MKSTNLIKRKFIDIGCGVLNIPQYNITSSKKSKFTWFRIAKNGTSTITPILSKTTNPEIVGYEYPYIKRLHEDRFKFCFIRNPWDRLASCYKQKVLQKNMFPQCWGKDFAYFLDFVTDQDLNTSDQHIRRQITLFPRNDMDHIALFENFSQEFNYIFREKIGLDVHLEHRNKSFNKKHYSSFYTNKLRNKISELYAADIELGNYTFQYVKQSG